MKPRSLLGAILLAGTASACAPDPENTIYLELAAGRVVIETVESGKMTKDLALLVGKDTPYQTTEEFLATLDENLQQKMAAR